MFASLGVHGAQHPRAHARLAMPAKENIFIVIIMLASLVCVNCGGGSGSLSTVANQSTSNSTTPALAAAFTMSPTAPAVNQTLQFTDGTIGNPTSWSWNFGDGATSTVQHPSHYYA